MRSANHSVEHFFDARLCAEQLLKDLKPETVQALESAKRTRAYRKGSLIFSEGEAPRGVYLLRHGCARLILDLGRKGERTIRSVEAGEVLGLSATIADEPYEATLETLTPCRVDFINRQQFLRLLHEQPEVCFRIVQLLGHSVHVSCDLFRQFDKPPSAAAKLARLLLSWCEEAEETKEGVRLKLPLTHLNIARLIGTSRETVTRTFSQFKQQGIICPAGSTLLIPQKSELEKLTQSDLENLHLKHASLIHSHENSEM